MIELKPGEKYIFEKQLPPEQLASLPRNLQIQVLQGDNIVFKKASMETNAFVALLGPKPHIKISLKHDDSPEANIPTDEMTRVIAKHQKQYFEESKYYREALKKSPLHAFSLFCCYRGYDIAHEMLLRPGQFWSAYADILGLDKEKDKSEAMLTASDIGLGKLDI